MICQMDLVINFIPFGVLFSAIQNLNESWPSLHIQHENVFAYLKGESISNNVLFNSVNIIPMTQFKQENIFISIFNISVPNFQSQGTFTISLALVE